MIDAASPAGYRIRPAAAADLAALPAIERRAAARFRDVGLADLAEGPVTAADIFESARSADRLWVAQCGEDAGGVVGFALVHPAGRGFHLQEMDVLPEHGRRGVGRRLVEAAARWASGRGAPWLSLTTFRHVPWNAPFYARLGFEEWPSLLLTPELRAIVAEEIEAGLQPELRLVMRRSLE